MRSLSFLIVLLAVCDVWADPPSSKPNNAAPTGQIVANLGKREVILESGRYGLKYFPDECLAFVRTTPQVRLLMAADKSTFLLVGRDMKSLVDRGEVLKPGRPGSFDNGYAGIGGVVRDPRNGQLLAFYHAEDHEGMRPIPGGIPGFYCCVALAVSNDNGTTFRKLGPVIKSSLPKNVKGGSDLGRRRLPAMDGASAESRSSARCHPLVGANGHNPCRRLWNEHRCSPPMAAVPARREPTIMIGMDATTRKRRWFCPTPGWLILALLVVEYLLWLAERFRWFAFNEHKGWTVLTAVASVGIAIVLMLVWLAVALVFRCRFQFSIRSLLVLTVAIALPFSWFAVEIQEVKREQKAAESIRDFGGSISWSDPSEPIWLRSILGNDFFRSVDSVFLRHTNVTDAGLENLKWMNQVKFVNLNLTQVTDAGLENLKTLRHLELLYLGGTKLSDAGLRNVTKLNRLQFLSLDDTEVTSAGLQNLKSLDQLKQLSLMRTKVSDIGLENLKGTTQLQQLFLSGPQITDAGLRHIKGLNQLQYLILAGTNVTDTGLETLKGLDQLKWLTLDGTKVTDAGLQSLKALKQLESLGFVGTRVTETGLETLRGLNRLYRLELYGTKLTDADLRKLQQALPNCKLLH